MSPTKRFFFKLSEPYAPIYAMNLDTYINENKHSNICPTLGQISSETSPSKDKHFGLGCHSSFERKVFRIHLIINTFPLLTISQVYLILDPSLFDFSFAYMWIPGPIKY